jgi:D-3-phosphoglycerate dehydrogenase
MSITVVVTDDRFGEYDEEREVFSGSGIELLVKNLQKEDPVPDELIEADGILCNLFPMPREVIEQLKKCRIITRYGVGFDNVDIRAAESKGIWVANVPDYSVEEVTDHILMFLFGCVRRIISVHREAVRGGWNLGNAYKLHRMKGKNLGIIGYGKIGQLLHRKTSGFGFSNVFVYDPFVPAAQIDASGGKPVGLDCLLESADYISITVPLTDRTRHMIGPRELAKLKKTAVIINTSRGSIIDESALISLLEKEPEIAAGLDVFEEEPIRQGSPLLSLDSVIVSPHMAYYSVESVSELKKKAALNILEVFSGRPPLYPVNQI